MCVCRSSEAWIAWAAMATQTVSSCHVVCSPSGAHDRRRLMQLHLQLHSFVSVVPSSLIMRVL